MARPYTVQLTLSDSDSGRSIHRLWHVPVDVEITTGRLAPLGVFLLKAIAELDSVVDEADGDDL